MQKPARDSAETRRAIETLTRSIGWPAAPLLAIAARESSFNNAVEHRLPADAQGAARVWARMKDDPRYYAANPHRDAALWSVGRGAYGQMTPYWIWRWDRNAHPYVLHDPWISTVIALRGMESMRRNGRDWGQINEAWASGSATNTSAAAQARRERFRARLEQWGGRGLIDRRPPSASPWGTGPQADQVQRLATARGTPTPAPSPVPAGGAAGGGAGAGLVVAGLVVAIGVGVAVAAAGGRARG